MCQGAGHAEERRYQLASGASEKDFEVTSSRMSENAFLECRKTLRSSKLMPKVIYYIVLYSINVVFGIISSSRY